MEVVVWNRSEYSSRRTLSCAGHHASGIKIQCALTMRRPGTVSANARVKTSGLTSFTTYIKQTLLKSLVIFHCILLQMHSCYLNIFFSALSSRCLQVYQHGPQVPTHTTHSLNVHIHAFLAYLSIYPSFSATTRPQREAKDGAETMMVECGHFEHELLMRNCWSFPTQWMLH